MARIYQCAITIFVLAAAISSPLASRARMRLAFPKNLFISVFEWFGELGFFCARLFRAALVPPYEFGELLRQCDEIGSKSLPLVALAGRQLAWSCPCRREIA